ncbi:MAG: hypothetical protein COA88_00710 [Kordia sp.]|nr:MAG: hypothetical protein COA88_00710 [Kordia sp.]
MKKKYSYLFLIALSFLAVSNSWGQLNITSLSTNFTIDFDGTISGVNNGAYDGTGFDPAPSTGQLDSSAWASTGLSNGDLAFEGTSPGADYTRGASTGGVTTGGFYAFEVAGFDYAMGIQPIGSDFTPGTITLKVTNNSGSPISEVQVDYELWILNDQGRANSLNFSYSTDDSSYTNVVSLDHTSPEAADGSPAWVQNDKSTTITGLTLNNGETLYLRWTGNDSSGSGSRDEFAIDDITVNFVAALSTNESNFKNTAIYAVNNSILIDGLQDGHTTLELYNISGKLVKTNSFNAHGSLQKIKLSESLSKGIYIVRLQTKIGVFSKKIILQ